ncbi:MAG: hypothetical protein ACLQVM_00465 [Terriglobia bacterium]
MTFAFCSPMIEAVEEPRCPVQLRRGVASVDWGKDLTWSLLMAEGGLLSSESPPHRPWTLPPQGLAVFHGDKDTARLSHYFLPRLLLQGKRVLMLDGANCADPRLLERLARQRRVPFEQFNRQIQVARAFTCFQLTELIARVPQLLTDFPAEVLMVTAFPELYFDEDVRDWNAQVAFEQALANLQRLAVQSLPLTVALFSSATTFTPSPARKRFFEKACAAGSEVWQFNSNAEGKLGLVCRKRILGLPAPRMGAT